MVSDLLHLANLELNRRRPSKDRDGNLQSGSSIVDLFDSGVKRREWTIRHANLLAHFKEDQRLRPLNALLDLMQEVCRLRSRNWYWLFVRPEKTGHLRRVLDE